MVDVGHVWVGDGTDCHILTSSSSDYSCTSSSFCWAAQPGSWGPEPSVWRCLSLRHLVPDCDWNLNSNWFKPSVAPGYIIVWHLPAFCGRTHLHRSQLCPQVKVITRYLRPDAPVIYTVASLNWQFGRGLICYKTIPSQIIFISF